MIGHEVEHMLESLISRYGLRRVLLAPYSLAPTLSSLGLLQDQAHAIAFGVVGLLAASLIIVVALAHEVKGLRRANAERQEIIDSYVTSTLAARSSPQRWEKWIEYQTVGRGGDTTIEQYLTLRVVRKTPLRIVWIAVYSTTDTPLSAIERRKISVSAARFTSQDNGGQRIGAPYRTTERWENNNRLLVMIHFDKPLQYDEMARIYLRWNWPGFYRSLIAGGRDAAEWTTARGKITHLVASLTFREECRLHRGLEIEPHPDTPVPRYHVTQEGAVQIDLENRDIPLTLRKVGLCLDAGRNHRT